MTDETARFIAALGSVAAWPLVARGQQSVPVIGRISMGAASEPDSSRDAFVRGLNETGFFIDRNVTYEYRTADGQVDRLPALVGDLVQRKVAVIWGNLAVAVAAKAATSTIPIVFVTTADPLAAGVLTSFNRPGGNVTGIRMRAGDEATAKAVELIHELLPGATTIGMLISPKFPDAASGIATVEAAARSVGLKVIGVQATVEGEFEPAMARLAEKRAGALLVGDNIYFTSLRDQIARLAVRYRLPVFAGFRSFTVAGALASYGASDFDGVRQGGIYVGRILKGEKPGDLPVIQPTKFELVINLKTAKALGLEISPSLLARADEVIE
jgi:putative tryptophan/tyrosine transport system substrate-binding protein